MKKIKIICGSLVALVVMILLALHIYTYKSYAYIENVNVKDDVISFDVDGSISGFYNRYELVEKENGEYEFQLYEEIWFGKRYPQVIEVNNKDHRIKKIIQKKQNKDGYEVIYEE